MNSQYVYLSNIPSNTKPVLFLHDFHNKWARMLYLENSFSGLRDALIYNPVKNHADTVKGVERLRAREANESNNLNIRYVFFPPPDVFLTTMIPDGATMLPYILLENLHKEAVLHEIITDLPLQATDLKPWDIPERNDKCLLIKLPNSCTFPMRSFILGTLRSRCIHGYYPKVSELIISENPILGDVMVPRLLQVNQAMKSYRSNLFYLHEIPPKITVKMLIEATKSENIKGSRVFFLEMSNRSKFGFLYVPKSLPNNRFISLFEKLRDKCFDISAETNVNSDNKSNIKSNETRGEPRDIMLDDEEDWDEETGGGSTENKSSESKNRVNVHQRIQIKPNINSKSSVNKIKINEVWFQPEGCEAPNLDDIEGSTDDDVMILTHYLYISGVPNSITSQQLLFGCPNNLKLSLFSVNEMDTQLGFLVLPRGMNDESCSLIIRHLRGLNFNGCSLEVNEIYIYGQGLAKTPEYQLPFQFIGRQKISNNTNINSDFNPMQNVNNLMSSFTNNAAMAGANAGMQDSALLLMNNLGLNNSANNNNPLNSDMARLFTAIVQSFSSMNSNQQQQMTQSNVSQGLTNQMYTGIMNGSNNQNSSNIPVNQGNIYLNRSNNAGNNNNRKRNNNFFNDNVSDNNWRPENIKLISIPDDELSLMKTEFICVDNLPRNIGSAALLVSAGRASGGCVILPSSGDGNKAFMYFPDCSSEEWLLVISNLSKKSFSGKQALIREVYLQTDVVKDEATIQILIETNVVFVYNIDESAQLSDIYKLNPQLVHQAELMETNVGSKNAFIVVNFDTTQEGIEKFVKDIRKIYIGNKPLYADIIRLAPIQQIQGKRRRN